MTKTCTKCGNTLPLDCYQRDASKKDGRRPACKTCTRQYQSTRADHMRQYVAAWRAANPDYNKQWRESNRDKTNAAQRAYYHRNKEQILERFKPYQRTWLQANKHLSVAARARRRAREREAAPAWADATVIAFLYATRQYMSEQTGELWHVDHIVPLQGRDVCGLHTHNNLRVVPASFNLAKGNKHTH